jgi:DNA polymerase III subunit gamma/tau
VRPGSLARRATDCTGRTVLEVEALFDEITPTASLAVRHRPRRFRDVIGQRHVKVPLQRAISAGRLPQQILLSGGSGLGKTTLARICAAALMCDSPEVDSDGADACGRCASCRDIAAGNHLDVIEIDAASHGRVDEIRELASRAYLAPLRAKVRVYIVDEAHGLSAAGGQAFLKLLEEPPAHVRFLLATTDPDKMLHTNRSRCAEFELLPPSTSDLTAHLVAIARREGVEMSGESAELVIGAAARDLGVRGAVMALDKVLPVLGSGPVDRDRLAELLGEPPTSALDELVRHVVELNPVAALRVYAELRDRFPDRKLLDGLAGRFTTQLVDVCRSEPVDIVAFEAASVRCRRLAEALSSPSEVAAVSAVVDLATPRLDAVASTGIVIDRAERARLKLLDAVAAATSVERPRDPAPTGGPETRAVETSLPAPEPEADVVEDAGGPRDAVALQAAVVEHLGPASRLTAAILRGARPSLDADVLVLSLPKASLERVRPHEAEVARSAQALAIAIRLDQRE